MTPRTSPGSGVPGMLSRDEAGRSAEITSLGWSGHTTVSTPTLEAQTEAWVQDADEQQNKADIKIEINIFQPNYYGNTNLKTKCNHSFIL